ncbi:MAG: hypothetical protein J6V71_00910 [Clostridia bacterium]|nr:hypothetical protein [Clostridia bacterium]
MSIFKKKNKEEIVEEVRKDVVEEVCEEKVEEVCETEIVVAQQEEIIEQPKVTTNEEFKREQTVNEEGKSEGKKIYESLQQLAILLNTSVDSLKEEFYLTQIKKIMIKLQKAVVRYDMTESEMDKLFLSASKYGLGGITVAPAYLQNCVRQNKKNKTKIDICSIIDFPFGESSLKGKISNVKESLKMGANSVAIAMPSMLFNPENLKMLKKQCKTLCRASKRKAGIVINASDINEEKYAKAMKILNKSKLNFVTLAFGDATKEEVERKLNSLAKCGLNKKLYVLANVNNVESVVELFKCKVDCVLTPYADEIGTDLLKRFGLI